MTTEKEKILQEYEKERTEGTSQRVFSKALCLTRSLLSGWHIRWKRKELENRKPIAKSHPKRIPDQIRQDIISRHDSKVFGRHTTHYAISVLCKVSRQFVDKVIRQQREPLQQIQRRIEGTFKFLPHIAWSIDFMQFVWSGICLYMVILIEESSRKKLGFAISTTQAAEVAKKLVQETRQRYNVLPLVLKHDGGPPFKADSFQALLASNRIASLPSVFYYPKYNGRAERTVKDVKKILPEEIFTMSQESIEAENCLMDNVPKRMLNGKTSNEAFWQTIPQKDFDRENFIQEVQKKKQQIGDAFAWKGGDAKFQRLAVEEVLKEHQLCLFKKGETHYIESG